MKRFSLITAVASSVFLSACLPDLSPDPTWYVDTDNDGFGDSGAAGVMSETAIVGSVTNNRDCNDGNPAINPNALETVGDGSDNDCNGNVDSFVVGNKGPAGGVVIYLTDSVTGLEMSPVDVQTGNGVTWGCFGTDITDAALRTVAAGLQNSSEIETAPCNVGDTAANAALNYELNGNTDWFLPAIDTLQEVFDQKSVVGSLTGEYWSSTESSSTNALHLNLSSGTETDNAKGSLLKVRAVRAFAL